MTKEKGFKQDNFVGDYVTKEYIEHLLEISEYQKFHKVFDKLTIVIAKLPNGFTLVGSSGCVDPRNYSEEIGEKICMEQIKDQLWKLEGFALQDRISQCEW